MKIINIKQLKTNTNLNKTIRDILLNNGVIVYPTDTCYGIGVNAFSQKAIEKLYQIKQRPKSKPTHVVVKNWKMVQKIAHPNSLSKRLFEKLLPGRATIIMKKRKIIPNSLTGNLQTIGIRIPDNPIVLSFMETLDFPVTTPSANRNGENPPYSIPELKRVLNIGKVDLVIDAGKLPKRKPSTIIDTTGNKINILREGEISKKEVLRAAK